VATPTSKAGAGHHPAYFRLNLPVSYKIFVFLAVIGVEYGTFTSVNATPAVGPRVFTTRCAPSMPKWHCTHQWEQRNRWRDQLVLAAIEDLESRAMLAETATAERIREAGLRVLPSVKARTLGFVLPPQWPWGRIN